MVTLIDYGAGNLASVINALDFLQIKSAVAEDGSKLSDARCILLPGVGHFGKAMQMLHERNFVRPICDAVQSGVPFLGICLGMQLLFEESQESPGTKGLGLLPGIVQAIKPYPDLKIPHMGWNSLDIVKPTGLFAKSPQGTFVYFVHSFAVADTQAPYVAAKTTYGDNYVVAVQQGNLCGAQFHPEKSGKAGIAMLKSYFEEVGIC